MQCLEYSEIWLNLIFAAQNLTFIRGKKDFPVFHADRVIIKLHKKRSRSTFQNVESTMWLAKLGKGMLYSVEQAFVGRDERRAPLKTPAWEAKERQASKKFYNKCSENSRSQIVFRTDIFPKIAVGCPWRNCKHKISSLSRKKISLSH